MDYKNLCAVVLFIFALPFFGGTLGFAQETGGGSANLVDQSLATPPNTNATNAGSDSEMVYPEANEPDHQPALGGETGGDVYVQVGNDEQPNRTNHDEGAEAALLDKSFDEEPAPGGSSGGVAAVSPDNAGEDVAESTNAN